MINLSCRKVTKGAKEIRAPRNLNLILRNGYGTTSSSYS